MKELISIIIPVYNKEKYLKASVSSVLKQTYKNIEIILVDDGSTDNSGKICDEFAAKYPNIKVIHQANAGPSAARNAGMDAAKGQYIGFVDADDVISPQTYKTALATILEYDTDLVMWSASSFNKYIPEGFSTGADYEKIKLNSIIGRGVGPAVWLELFKVSIIKKYGIRFPVNIDNNEDYIFSLSYVLNAQSIFYLKKNFFYDQRPVANSLSTKYHPDWPQTVAEIILILEDLLSRHNDLPYQSYLDAKILLYTASIVTEETRQNNPFTFAERINRIKEFTASAKIKKAFKNTDAGFIKKSDQVILAALKLGCYKTAYLASKIFYILFIYKRILKRAARRFFKGYK